MNQVQLSLKFPRGTKPILVYGNFLNNQVSEVQVYQALQRTQLIYEA